ncbi:MAG: InlB B-repeat-containing protein [Clostridia bacterium]|nr:InlB B-repeat-containing protein [Clostridia bacterium]
MKTTFRSKLHSLLIKALTAVFVLCLGAIAVMSFGNTTPVNAATAIKPFALYTFEDASNLGKDTSGNGFHLTASGTNNSALDGSDRYLSLSGAGGLYATGLSGIKDFSDYMKGSYTVRMIIKSGTKGGANYLITTGQYNGAFTVVNNTNIEVQVGNNDLGNATTANKLSFSQATTSWIDLVVVGDAVNRKATVYVNGVQKASVNTDILFSLNPDTGNAGSSYSFCIGMQGNTVGGAQAQRATCDYKKVEVYNCALTQANITEMYASGAMNGSATVASGTNYVTQINTLDTSMYNFNLTDKNTFAKISANLPATVPVTISNGTSTSSANASVVWFGDSSTNTIKGILMDSNYLNASQLVYSVTCKQGVVFNYDSNLVTLSDIKIDGVAYTPGATVAKTVYTLTFKATPKNNHIVIDDVKYHDVKWNVASDNSVSINVTTGGAQVDITAGKIQYKVTYYDDEFVLGVSRYTYQGSEQLFQWDKQGYTFDGWYSDEAFQTKVTALPYNSPTDLNLYAKFVKIPTHYRVYLDGNFNSNQGTVTGFVSGQQVAINGTVNITVSAKTGYKINTVIWNGTAVTVSNTSSFTFSKTVTQDSTLIVTFISNAVNVNRLYLDANFDTAQGTVTGFTSGEAFEEGTSATVTVSAKSGYKINTILWNNESITFNNTATFTFTKVLTEDTTLTVTYQKVINGATLTVECNDLSKGSITGVVSGMVYDKNSTINATITPMAGYYIQSITWNGEPQGVTNEKGMTFTKQISEDSTLVVNFAVKTYNIIVNNNDSKGLVTGLITGAIAEGSHQVTITPMSGYAISSVTFNGAPVTITSANGFTFTASVTKNTTLTVSYTSLSGNDSATITINNSSKKGTVSGVTNGGEYAINNTVNVEINAKDGYVISKVEWNDTEINVSPKTTELTLTLLLETDTTLSITYEEAPEEEVSVEDEEMEDGQVGASGCFGNVNPTAFAGIALVAGAILVAKRFSKKEN